MKGEETEWEEERKEGEKWREGGETDSGTAGCSSAGSEQPWPHSPVRPQWAALIEY